jgi:hypothetical protein
MLSSAHAEAGLTLHVVPALTLLLLQLLSGGSVDGAALLGSGDADMAFNWAGEETCSEVPQPAVAGRLLAATHSWTHTAAAGCCKHTYGSFIRPNPCS